jgi:hypothetical protein
VVSVETDPISTETGGGVKSQQLRGAAALIVYYVGTGGSEAFATSDDGDGETIDVGD